MGKLWEYIGKRLGETSTWKGLILLLSLVGVALEPEQKEAILALGASIYGFLAVFFPDKFKKDGQ